MQAILNHYTLREFVAHAVDPEQEKRRDSEDGDSITPVEPIIEVYRLPKPMQFLLDQPGVNQGKFKA